jgi:hypothetical protein
MKGLNMNRIRRMVCLTLVFTPLLVHAGEPIQYEIEAHFVACPTNKTSGPLPNLDPTVPLATTYGLDPSALPASWKVLSSPIIITMAGQTAEIRVSEKPSQYFVKQSNGSFQLRQMDAQDEPGLALTVTVTKGHIDQTVKLESKIVFGSILKREELPGVSLDVGKPTVVTNTRQFTCEIPLGAWAIRSLSGYVSPDPNNSDRAIFVLMRVRRVKSIDASGRPIVE